MNHPQEGQATENQIIHRWRGGQSLRSIAKALGVSRWRVNRTVRAHQQARASDSDQPVNDQLPRPKVDRGSNVTNRS